VAGPAWWSFGRDTGHGAQSAIAAQALNRIAWSTAVDLAPPYRNGGQLLAHYGTPVISSNNTVLVPVKTGTNGGFRIDARSGVNGGLIWSAPSSYALPPHNWNPAFNLSLSAADGLFAPASGGQVLLRDRVDQAQGMVRSAVFYGDAVYASHAAELDAKVFINTPITVDAAGNAFFGFIALDGNSANLRSGIARLAPDGTGLWRAAADLAFDSNIGKVAMNCAPALSLDGSTVYVAVNAATDWGGGQPGYLLALDSLTLAAQAVAPLLDPQTGAPAWVSDDASACPTVGPDGDVYYGVLESQLGQHNARGWMLHWDATLQTAKLPGSFGWDDTASTVPASAVPSYQGSSPYLLVTK
jgi:hypothetical protein